MKKTIIFTGGHHNSALILARKFQKKGYQILWLGHRFASAQNKNTSQEYTDVVNAGIKFIELKSGKIHGGGFLQYCKTISSFFYCLRLLSEYKPQAIISFGGYLAVPPVAAGFFLKIPSFGHEQTATLGKANSFLLRFYRKLFITWPNPKLEKNKKVIRTGIPFERNRFKKISKSDLNNLLVKNRLDQFENLDKPLILISGGKQGCHILNKTIEKDLENLLENYNIFHQTGNNSETKDFQRLTKKRNSLTDDLKNSYLVADYTNIFTKILSCSDIVIGRSGAHTAFEVLNLKTKMIAIPLPYAYANEQRKNAQILVDLGLARIIKQKNLNPKTLSENISSLLNSDFDKNKVDEYIEQNFNLNPNQAIISEVEKYL